MLVLQRKIGQTVRVVPLGITLKLLTIYPQLTLQMTGPLGSITLRPGDGECYLPNTNVMFKVCNRHVGRAQLGFEAPRNIKVLRGELKEVAGCHR